MERKNACMVYYQTYNSLLYREARALIEKGFDVDIICIGSKVNRNIKRERDGFTLFELQARPAAEKSAKLYFYNLGMFAIKTFSLLSALHLKRKYSLVHITTPPDVMVFTALIPKMFGAKLIMDVHDIGPELFVKKLRSNENTMMFKVLKFLEKLSGSFVDHVITVTDIWRNKIVKRSVPSSKCSTLLNVPDDTLFKPESDKVFNDADKFNLYYHGSLEEYFGVDTLLGAMPLVRQSIPHVNLHIYGSKRGRLYDEFIAFINQNGMQDYVFIHDAVSFHALPQVLRDADLGIVPTKNGYFSDEAVSMKSMEYIFLNIPIVISHTLAHSYYYDESMVKFFKPGDKNNLAEAIVDLYNNPGLRSQNIVNAEKFKKEYGWNSHAKKAYQDIVDSLFSADK